MKSQKFSSTFSYNQEEFIKVGNYLNNANCYLNRENHLSLTEKYESYHVRCCTILNYLQNLPLFLFNVRYDQKVFLFFMFFIQLRYFFFFLLFLSLFCVFIFGCSVAHVVLYTRRKDDQGSDYGIIR